MDPVWEALDATATKGLGMVRASANQGDSVSKLTGLATRCLGGKRRESHLFSICFAGPLAGSTL